MSDDLDPTALLGEPTAQEQAAAYAAALRRQAFSGSLGSLLGNKGLADFGNHVTQTAEHDADALEKSQERSAAQKSLNDYRRRPQRLANGQTGLFDPSTGQMTILADAAPKVMRAGDGSTISVGPDNAVTQLVKPPPRKTASALLGGDLSEDAINSWADELNTTGQMPKGIGNGASAQTIKTRIANRAAERRKGQPGDFAGAHAGYGADSGSLKSLQKQNDAMEAYERTAGANLDTFLGQAKKIKDTGSPLFNKSVRWLDTNLAGNPEMSAFNAARQTAVQEIGKLLSGSTGAGGISDSARHEVEGLIGPDATLAQITSAATILKQDMANRHAAMKAQLGEMRGRTSSHPKTEPQMPAGDVPTSGAPTHYLVSPDGKMRIQAGPDGKPVPGAKPEPNPTPPKVAING